MRIYLRTTGRVVPIASATVGTDRAKAPDDQEFVGYVTRAGIGAEWFPVDRVSVVGATGIQMAWAYLDRPQGNERDTFDVTMFRSAIYLNLYF
jgi:hypothetical protein